MSDRRLSTAEIQQAIRVFGQTIPYGKIALTGTSGLHNRPFTTPNPWPWDWEAWDIHFGSQAEWNEKMLNAGGPWYYWATLIHELTHVWQGHHAAFAYGYIFNSLWHQVVDKDAYAYTAGQAWGDYNVEQQAHIVEDWYSGRDKDGRVIRAQCDVTSNLFPYIRDHIRASNP